MMPQIRFPSSRVLPASLELQLLKDPAGIALGQFLERVEMRIGRLIDVIGVMQSSTIVDQLFDLAA